MTVRISARLLEGTREEAAEWVEGLLNVAYKGAILLPILQTEEIPDSNNYTPDLKRNKRLKVFVNPFSGKVMYLSHFHVEDELQILS